LQRRIRACRACQLAGHLPEARPIRDVGRVVDRIMLIGQAPGARTDAARHHFTGPAGDTLERYFVRAGFPSGYFRERVYLTAMTRCFPGKSPSGKGDRAPSAAELALCRSFLDEELELVQPDLLVLTGRLAITAFLGQVRLADVVGTLRAVEGRPVLPLPHTSPVSRWLNDPANRARVDRAIELLADCRIGLALA